MTNIETKHEGPENKFNDPKMTEEQTKDLAEKMISEGKTVEVAKNFDSLANKLVNPGDPKKYKEFLEKLIKTFKEAHCMNECVRRCDKINDPGITKELVNSVDINDTASFKELINKTESDAFVNKLDNKTVDGLINKVNENGGTNSITEMAKGFKNDSFADKASNEALNEFLKTVTKKGNVDSITEMAKSFKNDSFADKASNEALNEFLKTVTKKGNVDSITEMAKSFKNDSFADKASNEALNEFLKTVTKKGNVDSMTEMAKSFRNKNLANKLLDHESINSFANKAIDSGYYECSNEIKNNENLMNKLDDDTKNKINSEASTPDEYLDKELSNL